jgi:LPS O-antigen subunit length determinant protein (WzzB/FepE family)
MVVILLAFIGFVIGVYVAKTLETMRSTEDNERKSNDDQ